MKSERQGFDRLFHNAIIGKANRRSAIGHLHCAPVLAVTPQQRLRVIRILANGMAVRKGMVNLPPIFLRHVAHSLGPDGETAIRRPKVEHPCDQSREELVTDIRWTDEIPLTQELFKSGSQRETIVLDDHEVIGREAIGKFPIAIRAHGVEVSGNQRGLDLYFHARELLGKYL